jgi:hypothetical protein
MGKIRGENDIEATIQRLDRLTLDESRATAAQTLEVVYGLVQHRRAIMDSEHSLRSSLRPAECSYCISRRRWDWIDKRYLARSRYVSNWLAMIGGNNI